MKRFIFILSAVCVLSGAALAKYSGGTGEPNDPYLIATPDDLNSIGLDPNDWDKHFKMIADINMSGITSTQFNVIGNYPYFTGVFDGNNHAITNSGWALIEEVSGQTAVIKNIVIINADVNDPGSGGLAFLVSRLRGGQVLNCHIIDGKMRAENISGLLVGINESRVVNCSSSGTCYGYQRMGGLVGETREQGTIMNCYSDANVTVQYGYAGGLVGIHSGDLIIDCRSAKLIATSSNTFESARLEYLLRDLKIIIDTTINGAINPKLFEDLALYEQEFALKALDGATPASVVISGGINASVFIPEVMASTIQLQGVKGKQTIEDVIKTFSDAHYKDIESEIRRGIAEGLTTDEIVNKIKYLSDNRTKAQCEAVIRTLANHVATTARSATFKQYEELFVGEKFLATLDSRTTIQCGIRDGGIWTFDGKPANAIAKANAYRRPALHYNCRSILVPELKPEYDLNIDSTRSSEFGQVSDKMTYNDWLKKQSPAFQDDVLGKTRGKLFRDGALTLEKFTDKKGAVLTLKELGAKEGVAKVVIPKATIPTIKFGYDGKFDGYVADIRDEAKIVIDKLPRPIIKDGARGSYSNKSNLLVSGDNRHTFLHEYGHSIDYKIAKDGFAYSEVSLLEALGKDAKHIELTNTKKRADIIESFKRNMYTTESAEVTSKLGYTYNVTKTIPKYPEVRAYSDIIDAMLGGAGLDKYGINGHGKKYYKNKGAKGKETFANLFAVWSDGSKWEEAKKYFPNLTEQFEDIMKGIQDGRFN